MPLYSPRSRLKVLLLFTNLKLSFINYFGAQILVMTEHLISYPFVLSQHVQGFQKSLPVSSSPLNFDIPAHYFPVFISLSIIFLSLPEVNVKQRPTEERNVGAANSVRASRRWGRIVAASSLDTLLDCLMPAGNSINSQYNGWLYLYHG